MNDAEPGPAYICAEVISGGNNSKPLTMDPLAGRGRVGDFGDRV
jgi:hypothetical protein